MVEISTSKVFDYTQKARCGYLEWYIVQKMDMVYLQNESASDS